MWSYYGTKTNVAKLYPKPRYDKIIEPFAGTARYSLRYFENDIHLVDKYEVMIRIWKWLQKCQPDDILKLPVMKIGEKIQDQKIGIPEADLLLGFLCGYATVSPRKTMTAAKLTDRPNFLEFTYNRIAKNLFKIRHWKIECADYASIGNEECCWFIDPPYQFMGGSHYVHGSDGINYLELGEWTRSRMGQIIACEGYGANWLDFNPITTQQTSRGIISEMLWTNDTVAYPGVQQSIFQP